MIFAGIARMLITPKKKETEIRLDKEDYEKYELILKGNKYLEDKIYRDAFQCYEKVLENYEKARQLFMLEKTVWIKKYRDCKKRILESYHNYKKPPAQSEIREYGEKFYIQVLDYLIDNKKLNT